MKENISLVNKKAEKYPKNPLPAHEFPDFLR